MNSQNKIVVKLKEFKTFKEDIEDPETTDCWDLMSEERFQEEILEDAMYPWWEALIGARQALRSNQKEIDDLKKENAKLKELLKQ